jgi:hypothetical protein
MMTHVLLLGHPNHILLPEVNSMQFLGLNKNGNPQFIRLTRAYYSQTDTRTLRSITVDWVLVTLLINCACVSCSFFGFGVTRELLGVVLFIILPVPILISIYATLFTAQDSATDDYELLTLTPISDEQLVWGYIQAPFEQFKAIRGFPLGLMPFFAVVVGIGFLIASLMFQLTISVHAPQPDNMAYFMFASGTMILSYVGIYWLAIILGVAVGLALRRRLVALLSTLSFILVLATVWVWSVTRLFDPINGDITRLNFNLLWSVMALLPYIMVWLVLRFAYRIARRPLWNS